MLFRSNVHSADGWEGALKPVLARYRGKVSRIYFRADASFANPEVYEYLEGEGIKYAIRLPANRVLQEASATCSSALSAAGPTMSGASTRTSPIKPEPGRSRVASSPRSNDFRVNFTRASASS